MNFERKFPQRQEQKERKFSLIPYLWQYRRQYLIGLLLLLFVDLMSLYIPQYIGEIIDGLSAGTLAMRGVLVLLLRILFAGLVMMVGRFGWRHFIVGTARGVERSLRDDLFGHLLTLSARYFNNKKTGDLLAYFTNDLEAVREASGNAVVTVFDAVIMTIMVVVKMLCYVNIRLTILAAAPLVVIAVGCYFFSVKMERCQSSRQEAFSHLSDRTQESLSGVRVVKAFAQEEKDYESFCEAAEQSMKKNLAVVRLQVVFGPALDAITGISLLLTILFGGRMVLSGTISIGQFVAFISYIEMLVWPMMACGDCINTFTQAAASLKRIASIFAEKPDIVDQVPTNLTDDLAAADDLAGGREAVSGEISLSHLSFAYPGGSSFALSDISLSVPAGQMLGILGPTGSGKSTLADLLLRVYDCERGSLLLDGRPITDYPLFVLRKSIAYVPQDDFLFSDTVEENIAFCLGEEDRARKDCRERIHKAAVDACIDEEIRGLPKRYQTLIGERGVTLSGGQKQRLSIARALLCDAPILILDDALSAVDTDTEKEILANLMRLRKGKTTILIAHRISTLQRADRIAVLKEGHLIEYGTHEQLMAGDGFYAQTCRAQRMQEEVASWERTEHAAGEEK